MDKKKIIFTANSAWNLYNFRSNLINMFANEKYEVVVCAPNDSFSSKFAPPIRFIDIKMQIKKINPITDLILLLDYFRIYRKEKPSLIMSYTVKPNIYSSLASRILKIPTIVNITGLGYAFIKNNMLTALVKFLYQIAFKKVNKAFFHNGDDLDFFLSHKLVTKEASEYISGSGVDTEKFSPQKNDKKDDIFRFLLIGRMLKDKGVLEFIDAARHLKELGHKAIFQLLGPVDVDNPTSIPKEHIEFCAKEGFIEYLGSTDDVRPFISSSDCVVLPSYREGAPRTLLEAASMGKPLIATNVPGCRDVVENGVNGFLCNVQDSRDLANAMEKMLRLSKDTLSEFGRKGREKVIISFSEQKVIKTYIDHIEMIIENK
jgi:glycosyltransferase involved in cell wall biosynthesis